MFYLNDNPTKEWHFCKKKIIFYLFFFLLLQWTTKKYHDLKQNLFFTFLFGMYGRTYQLAVLGSIKFLRLTNHKPVFKYTSFYRFRTNYLMLFICLNNFRLGLMTRGTDFIKTCKKRNCTFLSWTLIIDDSKTISSS